MLDFFDILKNMVCIYTKFIEIFQCVYVWACVHGTCVHAGARVCVLALSDILKKKNRMYKIFVILHQNFGDLKYRVKLLTINALECMILSKFYIIMHQNQKVKLRLHG